MFDCRRGFPWISPDFWFTVGFFPARILHFRICFAKPPFGALRSLMGLAGSHAKHSTAVFGGTASMQKMGKSIQKWDMFMEFSGISEKIHGSTPTNKQNSKFWGDVTRIIKNGGCLLCTISRPVQSVFPLPRHRQKGSCASLRMCPVERRQPAIGRIKNCMANHLGNCNLTIWSS